MKSERLVAAADFPLRLGFYVLLPLAAGLVKIEYVHFNSYADSVFQGPLFENGWLQNCCV